MMIKEYQRTTNVNPASTHRSSADFKSGRKLKEDD